MYFHCDKLEYTTLRFATTCKDCLFCGHLQKLPFQYGVLLGLMIEYLVCSTLSLVMWHA